MKRPARHGDSLWSSREWLRPCILGFLLVFLPIADGCFTTINAMVLRESEITNTNEVRTYVFCPRSDFRIGKLDYSKKLYAGQEMIPLRPNLHMKCGDSGERINQCTARWGDVLVDGTHYYGVGSPDTVLDNVVIEGFTFSDAGQHMAWISKAGSITFRDCAFEGTFRANTPIFLDYFNASTRSSGGELSVTFERCTFDRNTYSGPPSHPAIVVGNGVQNRMIFRNSIFSNNDLVFNNSEANKNSFLVETSGPITMTDNCFENNTIGVSNVVTYSPNSAMLAFVNNYGRNTAGNQCSFISRYETATQYELGAPRCLEFDRAMCTAEGTAPPTATPTAAPTISFQPTPAPSPNPTVSPSAKPSTVPSATPTAAPTITFAPTPLTPKPTTAAPTLKPTSSPTSLPSQGDPNVRSQGGNSTSSGQSRWAQKVFVACLVATVSALLSR